ncbi:MAG TPA: lipid-A-disaccharide synthase [Rhabdochlamydiaceae bacterium]|nr:lipid-A-disaccharide synthase [Rhabdochlamydiaceae bacterium]
MKTVIDLFIIAGEASGDQLGEGLLQALCTNNLKSREFDKKGPQNFCSEQATIADKQGASEKKNSEIDLTQAKTDSSSCLCIPPSQLKIMGIGGPKMRAAGMKTIFPMENLQVMGFIDVLFALPHLIRCFNKTVDAILKTQPKAVVTIDYPGFNLRLARALRKKGFQGKICHYVCPSVWAWGKKRISLMAENLDLLLSILPFEKHLFSNTNLTVEYIGHPLVQKLSVQENPDPQLIAFFPGSRTKEIERNFPYFIRLIESLKDSYRCVVSVSQEKYRPLLKKMAPNLPLATPAEMKKLKPFLAVAKSGTITLELALQGIPTVVTYAVSPLDVFLAKHLFKISLPYYALPNLIANKPLFPELIGPALSDETLLQEVKNLITNHDRAQSACLSLQTILGTENANQRAAQLILTLLKE